MQYSVPVRERSRDVLPVVLLGVIVLAVANACRGPVGDPDLWWHLRLGSQLLDQHSLATPDRWSSFADTSWVPTEPIAEVVGAQFDRWFGLGGIAWLHGLALIMLVLSVYFTNRRLSAAGVAAIATVLTLVCAGFSLTPRPELLSFVLLPIVLQAWLQTEQDLRPRWWLIPLTWLWSLVHGYWFLGVGYGAALAAATIVQSRPGRRVSFQLLSVPLFSAVAVCLNPDGLGVFEAPFAVNSTAQFISEWRRTDLLGVNALCCELMIVITLIAWLRCRRMVRLSRVLLLISAMVWLWYASRTVAVAGLVLSPLLAEALQSFVIRDQAREGHRPGRIEIASLVVWAMACLAFLGVTLARTTVQPFGVPTDLDPSLNQLPAGTPVLDTYGIGGWIRWRHPDLNPEIDGLATPYSAKWFEEVQDADHGRPGWRGFVRETGARAALLQDGTPLIHDLCAIGWRVAERADGYWLLEAPEQRSESE